MSRLELTEHWSYWRDDVKIQAYRDALRTAITPESVVLDLGCGTGLLGLLACEAGARKVYAVDGGAILNVARDIALASPYADRIEHFREMSTRLELPEKVDVVVADQIGGMAFDAGTNEYFADARHRLATDDAVFIPGGFSLRLVPATCPAEFDELSFWTSAPLGVELSSVASLANNTIRQVYEQTTSSFLGIPSTLAEMPSWDTTPIDATVDVQITRAGCMHGVLGMFVADMAPGVVMTNDPSVGTPMQQRWQNFLPIDAAVPVEAGDVASVAVRADPISYQITWAVKVTRAGAIVQRSAHSTALGIFLGKDDLGTSPESPPYRLEPWRVAIERLACGVSKDELAKTIASDFPAQFADLRAASRFATEVWEAVR